MNKFISLTLVACGLLLLDSPEAAAHSQGHHQDRHADRNYSRSYDRDHRYRKGYRRDKPYYAAKYKRSRKMPHSLRRDRAFYRWYQRTDLRYDYYLSWQHVFDIYLWEVSKYRYHYH